jgi:hypothetical protein
MLLSEPELKHPADVHQRNAECRGVPEFKLLLCSNNYFQNNNHYLKFPHLYKCPSVNALPSLQVYLFPFFKRGGCVADGVCRRRRCVYIYNPENPLIGGIGVKTKRIKVQTKGENL